MGKFFVLTGIASWDFEMGNNFKDIAYELAKENKVLFINPPLDRSTKQKEKHKAHIQKRISVIERKESALEQIHGNLWVYTPPILIESINWIPNRGVFRLLNWWNNKKLASSIKLCCEQIGFDHYTIISDSDMFRSFHLKEMLKPQKFVYYSRDNLVAVDYLEKAWHSDGARFSQKIGCLLGQFGVFATVP